MANQTRILLISDRPELQNQVVAAMQAEPEFTLVDMINDFPRINRDVAQAQAELVVVDYSLNNQPTIDIFDDILVASPDSAIIAILQTSDPALSQQAILAGARAFVIQPFSQINLLSTLRRVRSLEQRRTQVRAVGVARQSDIAQPVRIVTVFSPRGGVGTSTVATNLAIGLQEETGMRTLLMDGNLFFGHLDLMLNIRNRNNLADLLPHASHLDETLIKDVVVDHISGIEVLLTPNNLSVAQGVRPEDLFNMVSALSMVYKYFVIDAGHTLNENTVTLLDVADRVLLVTNPDLASLKDTSRFIQVTWGLSYSNEKILVVLNRAGIPGGIRSSDITGTLHQEVFMQIPDEGPRGIRSINSGIPLMSRYPRSGASKAIRQIAKELTNMKSARPISPIKPSDSGQTRKDALLASSQFG